MINMMKYEYMSARIYTYNHVYIYIHACHFGPLMSNLKRPHFPFVARQQTGYDLVFRLGKAENCLNLIQIIRLYTFLS